MTTPHQQSHTGKEIVTVVQVPTAVIQPGLPRAVVQPPTCCSPHRHCSLCTQPSVSTFPFACLSSYPLLHISTPQTQQPSSNIPAAGAVLPVLSSWWLARRSTGQVSREEQCSHMGRRRGCRCECALPNPAHLGGEKGPRVCHGAEEMGSFPALLSFLHLPGMSQHCLLLTYQRSEQSYAWH